MKESKKLKSVPGEERLGLGEALAKESGIGGRGKPA